MLDLEAKYLTRLNDIKVSIQHSAELAAYLEEEEDELYLTIKEKFEPGIEALYNEVAEKDPLQIIMFERELLNAEYEGLFLPRVLGYAVMRGQVNENTKYVKPQEHFKDILLTICNSANFDVLQSRSGKTIEIGFALSSDIWITNLFNEITNKKVRQYLEEIKLPKYRDDRIRLTAYIKYKKQFTNFNYLTADLPNSVSELALNRQSLIEFLMFRALSNYDNANLKPFVSSLIELNFPSDNDILPVLLVIGLYYNLDKKDEGMLRSKWEKLSKKENFEESAFLELIKMLEHDSGISSDAFSRFFKIFDGKLKDEFIKYLEMMVEVDSIGYINDEAAEKIRAYYNNHKGLSLQNEATRVFIFNKFKLFISSLSVSDYHEYFEFNPVFVNYMNIFANEKFNQSLKSQLLLYVRQLLRTYTDKRGKDYQDVKKFVQPTFVDMGFMNEKSVKELFKKKRSPAA